MRAPRLWDPALAMLDCLLDLAGSQIRHRVASLPYYFILLFCYMGFYYPPSDSEQAVASSYSTSLRTYAFVKRWNVHLGRVGPGGILSA